MLKIFDVWKDRWRPIKQVDIDHLVKVAAANADLRLKVSLSLPQNDEHSRAKLERALAEYRQAIPSAYGP